MAWPDIAQLSFPDEDVLDWSIDPAGHSLRLSLSGGWLDSAGGRIGSPVVLTIGPWFSASEAWNPARPHSPTCPSEPLKDVCECGFGPDSVWLAGFSAVSGDWVRYEFAGPVLLEWPSDAEPSDGPYDLNKM